MSLRRVLVLLSASLAVLLMVSPAVADEDPTFSDTAGTSHEPAVAALAGEGIVSGCEEGRFCGQNKLTRGQVASILVRALDLPVPDGPIGDEFGDIVDSVHAEAIEALADAGLTGGCGDGRFFPRDPISRAQLATLLTRALDLPAAPEGQTYFNDVGGTHAPSVASVAEQGIGNGCTLLSFCPNDDLQRSHAAMFFARALDLVDRVELAPFTERKAEHTELVQAEAPSPGEIAGQRAVEVALAQLGKPYRWGGSGPNNFDCSGLTSFAWRAAGVEIPRTSRAQYAGTTRISRSELRPGDLVFYHSPISHVAMYIGDGRVVEAPNSGNQVRIRNDGLTRRGIVGYGRP